MMLGGPSKGGRMSDGTGKLLLVMIGSVALSAAGVVYAVCCGVAADGGRGGALAVALTFYMLFVGRGTPKSALEVEIPVTAPSVEEAPLEAPGSQDPDKLKMEVARVRNAIASMLDWQGKEKVYLTISSVVGTITWGFGDIFAAWFGAAAQ